MDMRAARQLRIAREERRFVPVLLTLLVAIGAAVQQAIIGLDTDVSWLITVSERMLGGDRLYVDVMELNPPASVLIYLPWVAMAHELGLKVEAVVAAMVFLLAGASFWCSAAILRVGLATIWLLPIAAFAGLIVAGASFAQREHVALLSLLPWIALAAARAEDVRLSRWLMIAAGIGAGLAIAVKPPFALAVALPVLAAAWRRRSASALFTNEVWACALVIAAYGALIVAIFPAYAVAVMPVISDGYLLVRKPLIELIVAPLPMLTILAGGLAVFLERGRLGRSPVLMPLLAAIGFVLAMLVQGKGFANHHYPALALSLIVLGGAVACGRTGERRMGAAVLAALAAASAFVAAYMRTYPEAAAIVRQAAPPRPTIIVAGTNLSIGHPLTRWVHGRWVGTSGSLWVTGTAHQLLERTGDPAMRTRLRAQIAVDRRSWLTDVRRERPDVILVDGNRGLNWLRRDPELAAATRNYRAAGSAEGIVVLIRR